MDYIFKQNIRVDYSVEVSMHDDLDEFFRFKFIDKRNKKISRYVKVAPLNISCGAFQLSGLHSALDYFGKIVSYGRVLSDIISLMKHPEVEYDGRFLICSDRKTPDRRELHRFLDKVSDSYTPWAENPRTENLIRVWTIDMDKAEII